MSMKVAKRLYLYVLKRFLPLFAMTFFIVLFIVLMQFLWLYINDLVGKGLSVAVLAELFFYAAVTMVPMALPLSILLASLMTFGNLGEKSELTAIKASGVSLLKVMSPLIIFISIVAAGAFFFQNDVLPRAQVKMWTLLFSARQKSPELEIPEGSFYDQIPGYSIYVKHKDRDTGMLYDAMIYDVKGGGSNATILLADSARLAFTPDMKYLYLHLFQGEQFENLRQQTGSDRNVPFRRESFLDKEIMIPFDANFNRIDEGGMSSQYIGKNIRQLHVAIDSIRHRIDSIGLENEPDFRASSFPRLMPPRRDGFGGYAPPADGRMTAAVPVKRAASESNKVSAQENMLPLSLDSLLGALSPGARDNVFASAANALKTRTVELEFRSIQLHDEKKRMRRHEIELLKKYTLSVACIIFLFIGAPLGAIIRKGGLGAPLVISVILFLVYYVIDNTGFKMAREGYWHVWIGIWLSTFVLLPLGIFVTYKAMNDSAVFNADLYKEWLRRRLGLPEKRLVVMKEVIINEVDPVCGAEMAGELHGEARGWTRLYPVRESYRQYWRRGYPPESVDRIGIMADSVAAYLGDSRDVRVIDRVNRFPVVKSLWILHPVSGPRLRNALKWFLPAGGLLYILSLPYARRVHNDMAKVAELSADLESLLLSDQADGGIG
jgi:lipopolysaccharide export system permease protein